MKITTSIKIDEKVKKDATKLASQLSLTLSSVINASLQQFVNERRVVFSSPPSFNTKTKAVLLKMRGDIDADKNIVGPFVSVDELKTSLLKK